MPGSLFEKPARIRPLLFCVTLQTALDNSDSFGCTVNNVTNAALERIPTVGRFEFHCFFMRV